MPPANFLHEHPDFAELLGIVAVEMAVARALVEKDYWIMHCLYGLQQLGMAFELKGGTSLSKGYGITHRFSEDIDIRIEPPASMDVKIGRNHDKPAHCESRKRFYDKVSVIDNRAGAVACYHPGYTLVEKLQTISTKYRKQQAENSLPANFIRHYYDVYCLLQEQTSERLNTTPISESDSPTPTIRLSRKMKPFSWAMQRRDPPMKKPIGKAPHFITGSGRLSMKY